MKKLPIGLSDFKRIIDDDYYYVDKSLFIKDIIDNGSNVMLLLRPRRFGKTLNLSMLKYFFEKTHEDTSYLFRNLLIWSEPEKYRDSQGKYPVIFLTFKDVKNDTWEEALIKIKKVINDEYTRHSNLLSSNILKDNEKDYFNQILNYKASNSFFEEALKNLSSYLERFHGKKAIILIDEYDAPILCGYMNGYYSEVINFMRNLLSGGFKDNSSLEKGVMTGILRVAKESIFSGLNNLEVCTLLNKKYDIYFGLLENEIEDLLEFYGIECEVEEVKKWYNGYTFGESTVYNPWSIINYTDKWEDGLLPYWVNTSSNDLIRKIITTSGAEVKKDLEKLIKGEGIEKVVDDSIVFSDVEKSSDTIWSFLLFSGYLKITGKRLKEGLLNCTLAVPNKEVGYLYNNIVLGWFKQSIHNDKLDFMLKSLISGDIKTFSKIFREFVEKTFSYFDTSGKEAEKVYHAFVLGLMVNLQDSYEIRSNRESGYGRYDVMLIPRDFKQKGIVFEFKKIDKEDEKDLDAAAEAALLQIEEKNYKQELVDRGVKSTVEIGAAFEGKNVLIKYREVSG